MSSSQHVVVNGSGNEVSVAGRDLYKVYLQLPEPTPRDRHNLLDLSRRVRQAWIAGVLEKSLRRTALLHVRMRVMGDPVELPWASEAEDDEGPAEVPLSETSIGQVFDQSRRTLLVLGEPGAGKTVALLTLARRWLDHSERDPAAPVPVVLKLSSWARSRKSIHDWIVGELARWYDTGEELPARWIEEHRLLLLLDGLDEVAGGRRAACVEAIHAFVARHGVPGLAITCRARDYDALPVKLELGRAVTLLPLTPQQVAACVDDDVARLARLRDALDGSAELRALAASPLMLNLMVAAFEDAPAAEVRLGAAPGGVALREEIFTRFQDRMFRRRGRSGPFSRDRAEDWLRWLAREMKERGESIFAVELLQPAWLTPRQLLLYAGLSRVLGGIMLAAAMGGVVCLGIYALVLLVDPPSRQALASTSAATVARVVGAYLAAAAVTGVTSGLLYAPFDYLRLRRPHDGRPREPEIIPDLLLFLGYTAVSVAAAGLVVAGAWVAGLSPRAPHAWPAVLTVAASVLAFPLFFWKRGVRRAADDDIGLAGTLAWQGSSARSLAVMCVLAVAIVTPFSDRFGVSRAAAFAAGALVLAMTVGYGGWRHRVPPPERWTRRGRGASALRDSGRLVAFGTLAGTLALFPLLWTALGPWASPVGPLSLAALIAAVLLSPALLWFGGLDLVLHASLRLVLALTGAMPLRLRRFLDYGVHLGFLQRAGGGYIFIHHLLLEHFAGDGAR